MAFSNLGSHNVLDPSSWQLDSINGKFCTLKSLFFLRISWYSQPAFNFDTLFSLCVRSTRLFFFFKPSVCHQPFLLDGHVLMLHRMLWKNLNELFGNPVLGRKTAWSFWLHSVQGYPASFACIPQIISLFLLTAANLSLVDEIVYPPINPTYLESSVIVFTIKILPLPLFK